MTSIGGLIERCADALEEAGLVFGHGTDNAWDEATALVLGVTGAADDRASLPMEVSEAHAERVETLLQRRIEERIPLAYLLGRCSFAGHEFLIEPGIVIPRSPIGELIEQRFQPWLVRPPATALDLCTGCGCIGIAAALTFPELRVTLVDVDPRATALARRNVERHGLGERVRVLTGDLYQPLPAGSTFEVILSNPPYVDQVDMSSLPAEYRHEPRIGLAGGSDGLEVVRRIIDGSPVWLSRDGALICEVGRSAPALLAAYPEQAFIWPTFSRGGEGVFILPAR